MAPLMNHSLPETLYFRHAPFEYVISPYSFLMGRRITAQKQIYTSAAGRGRGLRGRGRGHTVSCEMES